VNQLEVVMQRLIVAVLILTIGTLAHADAASDAAEVKRHYDEGTAAYSLGDFVRAAEEYKAAYKLRHDPVFLYNVAQAYRGAGDLEQAKFFYRSYLRNAPRAPNKVDIEERIRSIEEQIAHKSTTPPAGTVTPPTSPPPGESSTAKPTVPPPTAAEAKPPTEVTPATEAKPATTEAATTPAAATTVATEAPRKTPVYKKWWLWTTVGVVVVGVGLGVGLGLGLRSTAPSTHFSGAAF
jgi:tetratricopeptide (TPR) repeat protein